MIRLNYKKGMYKKLVFIHVEFVNKVGIYFMGFHVLSIVYLFIQRYREIFCHKKRHRLVKCVRFI